VSESGTGQEQSFHRLPQWKCHKVVRAAEIVEISTANDPGYWIKCVDPDRVRLPIIFVKPEVFSRRAPTVGDFLVVYDDGYISVSPPDTFKAGYSPMAVNEGAVHVRD
jgi:hypothetical protein